MICFACNTLHFPIIHSPICSFRSSRAHSPSVTDHIRTAHCILSLSLSLSLSQHSVTHHITTPPSASHPPRPPGPTILLVPTEAGHGVLLGVPATGADRQTGRTDSADCPRPAATAQMRHPHPDTAGGESAATPRPHLRSNGVGL